MWGGETDWSSGGNWNPTVAGVCETRLTGCIIFRCPSRGAGSANRFDIHRMQPTSKWWPLYAGVTLAEALHLVETDDVLQPC